MAENYPGGRHLISEALKRGGVPEDCLEVSLASITEATIKQYNGGLKQWWLFRKARGLDIYSAPVPEVLEFFATYFKKGASSTVLNSYRAALSQILGPNLTSDFRISRFFKGIHSLRPSLPKYTHTWDPSVVLTYIRGMPDKLSLEDLSYKLAMLLALATGQRVQTLASIELDNIIKLDKGVEIQITKRLKTSGKGRTQPILHLPFYDKDVRVCPARTLLKYLDETKDIRNSVTSLFITFKKPFHAASTQTIARWLKLTLSKSGIVTSYFTAHSTRHASTSAAARGGVSYEAIRLAAGWSQKSDAFARFYHRPIRDQASFANLVLDA
ncbi:unnamed protein product [Callosobruchus maculatus]|uniref:Tyr recombinase domain-containing protein n=1 Tax=Callosobruchus maculatus TaxID=64391 RepID=A0A653BRU7_CALMS|nr:unnamed protein product [Callosobruchus maculatus]